MKQVVYIALIAVLVTHTCIAGTQTRGQRCNRDLKCIPTCICEASTRVCGGRWCGVKTTKRRAPKPRSRLAASAASSSAAASASAPAVGKAKRRKRGKKKKEKKHKSKCQTPYNYELSPNQCEAAAANNIIMNNKCDVGVEVTTCYEWNKEADQLWASAKTEDRRRFQEHGLEGFNALGIVGGAFTESFVNYMLRKEDFYVVGATGPSVGGITEIADVEGTTKDPKSTTRYKNEIKEHLLAHKTGSGHYGAGYKFEVIVDPENNGEDPENSHGFHATIVTKNVENKHFYYLDSNEHAVMSLPKNMDKYLLTYADYQSTKYDGPAVEGSAPRPYIADKSMDLGTDVDRVVQFIQFKLTRPTPIGGALLMKPIMFSPTAKTTAKAKDTKAEKDAEEMRVAKAKDTKAKKARKRMRVSAAALSLAWVRDLSVTHAAIFDEHNSLAGPEPFRYYYVMKGEQWNIWGTMENAKAYLRTHGTQPTAETKAVPSAHELFSNLFIDYDSKYENGNEYDESYYDYLSDESYYNDQKSLSYNAHKYANFKQFNQMLHKTNALLSQIRNCFFFFLRD